MLRPYRVPLGHGREIVLRLSPETAAREYPDASELKLGPEPVTPETPKPRRKPRGTGAKKTETD